MKRALDTQNNQNPIPFLKWAGGKRWLVDEHGDLFPRERQRYIEPFLGGGSVFFYTNPKQSILADSNERLIEAYVEIRDNWENVFEFLHYHQEKHDKDYYYSERGKSYESSTKRAAQFIYLNRTCWNGLYRVNLKGEFNVPIGTKNSVLLDTDDFKLISKLLKNCQLLAQDFEETLSLAEADDFVYIDPPYTVNHQNNGFLKYNEQIFSWKDQVRLRGCVAKLVETGAKVIVSNADHKSIRELYKGIGKIKKLARNSVIAGSPSARGRIEEILIVSG